MKELVQNLQLGDRLIRHKGGVFSKHHGIYVGFHNGQHLVAENQVGYGVRYVELSEFLLHNSNNLCKIEKFNGSDKLRDSIIPRVNKMIQEGKKYDFLTFNCEHFANLVLKGKAYSNQITNTVIAAGSLALFGGILIAAVNE